MSRHSLPAAAALTLTLAPLSLQAAPSAWPAPLPDPPAVAVTKAEKLTAVRTAQLPASEPFAPAWKAAPYVTIPVQTQEVTMPQLKKASVDSIDVQALTDGKRIAFRLAWKDATPDGNVAQSKFTDAVALQLPLDPMASPMMGGEKTPVQILHWKALWQKDVDVGFQDVQDLMPNFWSDVYWFAEGQHPYPADKAFRRPEAKQWLIALSAGNPVAAMGRVQPVEELIAEGFGTLTHQPKSATEGRGVWANGKWTVVLSRPLATDDAQDCPLALGKPTDIALAVWEGSAGNVGGRKHWSDWTTMEIAP